MADPLWSTPFNEHRLEFLSRVTHADLLWSIDEYGVRGSDTHRGDIFVRYGPAPAVISFPADAQRRGEHRISLLWWYRPGVAFVFRLLPGYGLASLDDGEDGRARQARDSVPVTWTNLGIQRDVDSIDVQLTRFRGAGDSTDVFVAASVPVESMVRSVDLASGVIQTTLQLFNWSAQRVTSDSTSGVVSFQSPDPRSMRSWRRRLKAGVFLYRVEALQPAAMRGARATGQLSVLSDSGFGLSDLLVADRVSPKPDAPATARWTDFAIAPNVARVKRGQQFSVLWETYALRSRRDRVQYDVTLRLRRIDDRAALGRVAAAVVGGVRSAVGLSATGQSDVTLTFQREAEAKPAIADNLALELGETPAGAYQLTIEVTDRVSGRKTSRETVVTVLE
jgi:hypothetical protein